MNTEVIDLKEAKLAKTDPEKIIANLEVVNKYKYTPDHTRHLIHSIMRGSIWGNPFPIQNKSNVERNRVIHEYKNHLWQEFMLKGKTDIRVRALQIMQDLQIIHENQTPQKVILLCCCKPKACHGDIIKELLFWMLTVKETDKRHWKRYFNINGEEV